MFKLKGLVSVLLMIVLIFASGGGALATDWKVWDSKTNVWLDKKWTITFSDTINSSSVNTNTVFVTYYEEHQEEQQDDKLDIIEIYSLENVKMASKEEKGIEKKYPVKLEVNDKEIIVTPIGDYESNTEYTLYIDGVTSSNGKELSKPVKMDFVTGTSTEPLDKVNNVENLRWDAGVSTSYWGYYTGEVLNGIPHGKGKWIGDASRIYEGQFEHGEFHGEGILYEPDGTLFYEGKFENGHLIYEVEKKWSIGESQWRFEMLLSCLETNKKLLEGGLLSGTELQDCSIYSNIEIHKETNFLKPRYFENIYLSPIDVSAGTRTLTVNHYGTEYKLYIPTNIGIPLADLRDTRVNIWYNFNNEIVKYEIL